MSAGECITLPQDEVAFGLIKPGFEKDQGPIIEVIRDSGLEVVYAQRSCLTPGSIDVIYRSSVAEHFYRAMKQYLIGKEVLALIITGAGPESQDRLNILKKSPDGSDGPIRLMFSRDAQLSPEEIVLWENQEHPRQDEVTVILTQRNVLHSSDTNQDAIAGIHAVLGHRLQAHSINGTLPGELSGLAGGVRI
ncbi:MAG TPA: hypothetical protein VFJ84_02825 [Candidatus Saccharimonadales bacterium]|nr:hypothetical protein [Candidatus Saccharimonadales bacterium]